MFIKYLPPILSKLTDSHSPKRKVAVSGGGGSTKLGDVSINCEETTFCNGRLTQFGRSNITLEETTLSSGRLIGSLNEQFNLELSQNSTGRLTASGRGSINLENITLFSISSSVNNIIFGLECILGLIANPITRNVFQDNLECILGGNGTRYINQNISIPTEASIGVTGRLLGSLYSSPNLEIIENLTGRLRVAGRNDIALELITLCNTPSGVNTIAFLCEAILSLTANPIVRNIFQTNEECILNSSGTRYISPTIYIPTESILISRPTMRLGTSVNFNNEILLKTINKLFGKFSVGFNLEEQLISNLEKFINPSTVNNGIINLILYLKQQQSLNLNIKQIQNIIVKQ